MPEPEADARKETPQEPPLPGERVIAICEGFRCLAYRDQNGVWRDDARRQELPKVFSWVKFKN